jgi:hypothetical protein
MVVAVRSMHMAVADFFVAGSANIRYQQAEP